MSWLGQHIHVETFQHCQQGNVDVWKQPCLGPAEMLRAELLPMDAAAVHGKQAGEEAQDEVWSPRWTEVGVFCG